MEPESRTVQERVVVIGGGIAALAVALASKRSARELIILERDPEPPEIPPQAAFEKWARPGVPQFRHPHILLARVQTILRDRHPEVLQELLRAGLELSTFSEAIPDAHLGALEPLADDADSLHLWGRRATFEYVLRRHVERLPNVRFLHEAQVRGLSGEQRGRALCIRGVELVRRGVREEIAADLVIDASGKRTQSPRWLRELGVRVESDAVPSRFVYACRHYRLRDAAAPPPSRRDGGGNLDYLGYATFHAEHGNFALTFGCPVDDEELAALVTRCDGFEALIRQFPALQRWTGRADPRTKVLGAGKFENRWTRYGARGGAELHGFFAVGDSHVETNPMYGRGCASAFVQAEVLAGVLDASDDPRTRARRYARRTRALLQSYFDISVTTDRIYHARARLRRGLPVGRLDRLMSAFYASVFMRANHRSLLVAREFVKAQQMRDVSPLGLRLLMVCHILRAWVAGLFSRQPVLPPVPPREDFLRRVEAARFATDDAAE